MYEVAVVLKSSNEIEKMRRAGRVVREVLELVRNHVKPGATTLDLEKVAEAQIKELGAKPAFKGYHGFPCVLCTSVNSEVVHGIPSKKRVLQRRRHCFGGLRSDCRRLLWRCSHHGSGGRKDRARHGEIAAGDREVALRRHRGGKAGSDAGRYRRRGAGGCRSRRILGGTGFCGAWHRQPHARRSAGAELWRSGPRHEAESRHGDRDRAHGQCRQAGCPCSSTTAGRQ